MMLTRFEVQEKIDAWVFDEKDRRILKRHLCDGCTFEKLGEEIDMSTNGVKSRYKKALRNFDAAMAADGFTQAEYKH